jgi:hypothetical protein
MMFTALILITGILGADPAAPANDDFKQVILLLVRQLDSDQLAQRDAAEATLIEKGPAVLTLLPAENDHTSAELRERLARIRQKLDRLAVASAAKAALITLNSDALPLSKALVAIEDQSGNKIVDYRPQFGEPVTDPPLKIHFDKTPFWQALDQVLDQAGLTVYHYADSLGLNLVDRSKDDLPRSQTGIYSGPFRFEPVLLIAQRDLRDPKAQSLRLTFEAAWEPRLKPIYLLQRMADVRAVDDRGQPLPAENAEAEIEVPIENPTSAVELTLTFGLPPREVKQIARLQGKLSAVMAGKTEDFIFDNLSEAKNVEKQAAGVTVTLEQVRQNKGALEVFVRTRFDNPGDALASHRGWIFRNKAYLEGPDGTKIPYDNLETTKQTKNEFGAAYIFELDQPPTGMKFIYKTPTAILNAEVDYEFRNLKLP